jgi:hypothetical protein
MDASRTMLTVIHFSLAWSEESTGQENCEAELQTMLANIKGVSRYVKVTTPRLAVQLGVETVPSYVLFRGTEKCDECSGSDLSLLRQIILLHDRTADKQPYQPSVRNSKFPCSTGTFLPIFS